MAFLKRLFNLPNNEAKKKKLDIYQYINQQDDPEQNWEILKELGDGAYGKVYKAQHKHTKIFAAAKIAEIQNEEELEDFAVELNILSECRHRNILTLHESYYFKQKLWIMIEFCEIGALDTVMLELEKGLTESQIRYVCHEMCLALDYLHRSKVIHRDVKAGNVLLTREGIVKMADFGVSARNSHTLQKRDSFIGTPYWMAPEVMVCEAIKDNPYDYKADIWSLGVTLIEFAQMEPPNHEMNPMRVIIRIQKSDPPTLNHPHKWSKDFNNFLSRCLVKDPVQRATLQELLQHKFLVDATNPKPIMDLISELQAEITEYTEDVSEEQSDFVEGTSNEDTLSLDSSEKVTGPVPRISTPNTSTPSPIPPKLSSADEKIVQPKFLPPPVSTKPAPKVSVQISEPAKPVSRAGVIGNLTVTPATLVNFVPTQSEITPPLAPTGKILTTASPETEEYSTPSASCPPEAEAVSSPTEPNYPSTVTRASVVTQRGEVTVISITDYKAPQGKQVQRPEERAVVTAPIPKSPVKDDSTAKIGNGTIRVLPGECTEKGIQQTVLPKKLLTQKKKHQAPRVPSEAIQVKAPPQNVAKSHDPLPRSTDPPEEMNQFQSRDAENARDDLTRASRRSKSSYEMRLPPFVTEVRCRVTDPTEDEPCQLRTFGHVKDQLIKGRLIDVTEAPLVSHGRSNGTCRDDFYHGLGEGRSLVPTGRRRSCIEPRPSPTRRTSPVATSEPIPRRYRDVIGDAVPHPERSTKVESMAPAQPPVDVAAIDGHVVRRGGVGRQGHPDAGLYYMTSLSSSSSSGHGSSHMASGSARSNQGVIAKLKDGSSPLRSSCTSPSSNRSSYSSSVNLRKMAHISEHGPTSDTTGIDSNHSRRSEVMPSRTFSSSSPFSDLSRPHRPLSLSDDNASFTSKPGRPLLHSKPDLTQIPSLHHSPKHVPDPSKKSAAADQIKAATASDQIKASRRFKSIKTMRKFVIDGVVVTTTTSKVVTPGLENQTKRDFLNRKYALRELKLLQKLEHKQFQDLYYKAQFMREQQEKVFEMELQNIMKSFDNELETFNRQQKQQVMKAERLQAFDLKTAQKRILKDQEKEYKAFKESLKCELKYLKQEVESVPKDQRKEVFKKKREFLDVAQEEREKRFMEKQASDLEVSLTRLNDHHQEKIATLEGQFLQQKHQILRMRESALIQLEERHLHDKHQMAKRHLKDIFFLQRHQMLIRHDKEMEQVKKDNEEKIEELKRSHATERKSFPKRIKAEMKTRHAMYKESVRISMPGSSVEEEKALIKQFEEQEKNRYKLEQQRLEAKQAKQLEDIILRSETIVKELDLNQHEKRKMLMEHETVKLKQKDNEFHHELQEWQSSLDMRKNKMEDDFERETQQQREFYDTALSLSAASTSGDPLLLDDVIKVRGDGNFIFTPSPPSPRLDYYDADSSMSGGTRRRRYHDDDDEEDRIDHEGIGMGRNLVSSSTYHSTSDLPYYRDMRYGTTAAIFDSTRLGQVPPSPAPKRNGTQSSVSSSSSATHKFQNGDARKARSFVSVGANSEHRDVNHDNHRQHQSNGGAYTVNGTNYYDGSYRSSGEHAYPLDDRNTFYTEHT